MRTGPHAFYSTKIRRPVNAGPLPESIKNPTYQLVRDLADGKSAVKKPTKKEVK